MSLTDKDGASQAQKGPVSLGTRAGLKDREVSLPSAAQTGSARVDAYGWARPT